MLKQTNKYCKYLGKTYPLIIKIDPLIKKTKVQFQDETFVCTSSSDEDIDLNKALKYFYFRACRDLISKRLKIYQPLIRLKYRSFTIKDSNAVWGSCNVDKNLVFNWKLILFPLLAIDYVVVHELCHLKHMNHDRSFWRLVGRHYPNYKEAMKILGTEKSNRI